jgi:hypothetical protein
MKVCGCLLTPVFIIVGRVLARADTSQKHIREQLDSNIVIVTMNDEVVSWVNDYTGPTGTESPLSF